jgi:chaperonin GroES
MKIRPLNDWVLLRAGEAEEKSSGGIIIPEVAKEKPQWGTVEAVGPGRFKTEDDRGKKKEKKKEKKFIPAEVKTGDRVLYEKYMAKDFEVSGQKILMVREEYILGVFEPAGNSLQKKSPTAVEKPKKVSTAVEKMKSGPTSLQKSGKTTSGPKSKK